jgi:hypothetical protein
MLTIELEQLSDCPVVQGTSAKYLFLREKLEAICVFTLPNKIKEIYE